MKPLRVGKLLEEIGQLPDQAVIESDRNWRTRAPKRVDDALVKLKKVGVIEGFEWEPGLDPRGGRRPGYRWVEEWLDSKVQFKFPGDKVTKRTKAPGARRTTGSPERESSDSAELQLGEMLREALQQRGKNQKKFATEFGVSEGYLSRIIRGRQTPSFDTERRIMKWIRGDRNEEE